MPPVLVVCCTLSLQGRVPLETAEQRANEEEVVEKTTTQMYRAPEMVDLYLERELTERVDVWVRGGVLGAMLPSIGVLQQECCYIFLKCRLVLFVEKITSLFF